MALTITPRQVDANGQAAQAVPPGALLQSLTSITLDNSYAAGGVPLTPAQLSMNSQVVFGVVCIRTAAATGNAVNGTLDCSNPGAPKLKLNAAAAEVANGTGSGLVVDVLAFGL